ncbi:MAG: serine/threonine-protein kinase [Bacteroidota bacterium]
MAIDANHWDLMQSLYLQALDIELPSRDTFLKEATKDNHTLYLQVRALLEAETHPMFKGLAVDILSDDTMTGNPAGVKSGDQIDRYKVLDKIGEGGMGFVYRAERADGAYSQTVALKLVKYGASSASLIRRFEVERQILAELQHPGIANLMDGGVHADRPFLVMEYIDGLPITEYCTQHKLTLGQRLSLFEQVCDVVSYAHQNLIVHRDLKPSNILVTENAGGKPQVKLLDFGIAQLLEPNDLLAIQTQTGTNLFTPAYASPEQVAGKRISTAADIYGLGVVLYELLTGALPIPMQGRSFVEMVQAILSEEPAAPSDAVKHTDGSFSARLAGDLDAIILKALRKEPESRYVTVLEMVDDLRRHKENLPVKARQDQTGYRLRKFIQRHQRGIWTAVATFMVIAAVIVLAFARVLAERDIAQQETAKAEEVGSFLQSIFAIASPTTSTGDEVTARELLDRGAARIDEELANQPTVSAEMALVIGDAYKNLGQYAAADSLFNWVLELHEGLNPQQPFGIAKTLHALGLLKERFGAFEDATALHKEAIGIIEMNNLEAPALMADLLHGLGHSEMRNRRLEEAERYLEQSIALKKLHYGEIHEQVTYSLNVLGDIYQHQERYDESIDVHFETLAQRRVLHGNTHIYVSSSLHNLALALRGVKRYAEAEQYFRESLAIQQRIPGSEQADIANTMGALASVLRMDGRFEEAEPVHQDAIRIARATMGDSNHRLGVELARYGFSLYSAGLFEKAEPVALESLEIYRENHGAEHTLVAQVATLVGQSIWKQSRYEDAEPMLLSGFQTCEIINDQRSVCMGVAREALVDFYRDWGKPELAKEYQDK